MSSESDVIDQQLARDRGIFDRDIARFKNHFAAIVFSFRKNLIDGATHHSGDHPRLVRFSSCSGINRLSIAQHGNAIADVKDLVELMRDVNHRHAPCS